MRKYNLITALFTGCLIMIYSCKKDASEQNYGFNKIYIPQASWSSMRYMVPSGLDSASYNFEIENDKINIFLGIICSGKSGIGSYTVDVMANQDTINQLIDQQQLDNNTILMPAGLYSLPQQVSVSAGERSATFLLSLDRAKLAGYAGKKLALAVQLANPSRYQLNEALNKVIVIVDVDALEL